MPGDPAQDELGIVESEPPVNSPGVHLAQRVVLYPRDELRAAVKRGDPALGRIEVVLIEQAADRELVERHPAGDKVTHRRIAVCEPDVARVEAIGLNGYVRLGGEFLLGLERAQRRALPGRVSIEGEDDLAFGPVRVHDEPAQHLDVLLAERRAAGRHRGGHVG